MNAVDLRRTYTVSKKLGTFFFLITLSDINRF